MNTFPPLLRKPSRRACLRLLPTLPVLLALPATAARTRITGSGRAASEARDVGEFEAIAVAGPFDVQVRPASREALRISADDNLLPLVETVVENGRQGRTLKIRLRDGQGSIQPQSPLRVDVDVRRLSGLHLAGSGDVRVERLDTPALQATVAGSGTLRLDGLAAGTLELKVAGSGEVLASGKAARATVSVAGSGEAKLADLVADEVKVSVAGSGDADVTANQALTVSVAGSGDVRYGGTVQNVRSSVAGSGTVRRR
ncbi:head GIN domain-containing protein [Pseudorhodoferax sp.]|uniref:head GIN domain-containing protein n=1 Tax=Pseudorhodoferax sp. TaxID=1993553 RepID=UPI002DD67F0C|nr:head GIN domain-containing protein [Pseudorhodoferax sp.]